MKGEILGFSFIEAASSRGGKVGERSVKKTRSRNRHQRVFFLCRSCLRDANIPRFHFANCPEEIVEVPRIRSTVPRKMRASIYPFTIICIHLRCNCVSVRCRLSALASRTAWWGGSAGRGVATEHSSRRQTSASCTSASY